MQFRQKQALEAFGRVMDFLAAIPVPPPGTYGEAKATLEEVVARLSDHSTVQVTGKRAAKANMSSEATLRRDLLEKHLRPISVIARSELRGSPGIDKALTMPEERLPTVKLIVEARAMRNEAAPYAETFVKHGRAADFLEQLDAAVAALQGIFSAKARNVGKRVGAREGLKGEIERGRRAIAILDTIVTTTFASQPSVIAEWRNARRERAVGGRTATKPNAPAAAQPSLQAAATSTPHAA